MIINIKTYLSKIALYLKFIAPTVFFFILAESFIESFGMSLSSLALLFLLSSLSAFWISEYRFLPAAATSLFVLSGILFFLTLGNGNFQEIYALVFSFSFLILLFGIDKFFRLEKDFLSSNKKIDKENLNFGFNLNQVVIFASIFLFSSGTYGIYIDLDFSIWLVMITNLFGIFLMILYLTKINFIRNRLVVLCQNCHKNKNAVLYSFLIGFVSMELIWAMSFWPVSHLTIGSIILISCYSLWTVVKSCLKNELTRKKVYSSIAFFAVFLIIILATGNWSIY